MKKLELNSIAMLNKKANSKTLEKMKASHSKSILFTNIINSETQVYPYIKQAALEFNTSSTKIRRHIKNKSVFFFDLYLITEPS